MRIVAWCCAAATLGALALPMSMAAADPAVQGLNRGETFVSQGVSQGAHTYYVDSSRGDDTNDGTSAQHPWKTLTKVSGTTFAPGDHILLESNGVWNGEQLAPKGNGSKDAPIVVDLYTRKADGNVTYSASHRPVINGNGTYGSDASNRRYVSGAVQLVNQEHWTIRDIEVTNSPDPSNPNGYKVPGDANRVGILLLGYGLNRELDGVTVENAYVHDVQSEYYLKDSRLPDRLKHTGGIVALGYYVRPDGSRTGDKADTGFSNLTMQRNIVIRAGLEGIRTKAESSTGTYPKVFENVRIVNNYLQDIAGDAIVMSEVARQGLVEGNVVVHACAADYGTHNYAALWVMSSHDVLAQYNEVYGNVHGYNDGEAFDIDMGCSDVTYQYNYSHGNGGGFMLLMSDQSDSVVRYNISADDGFGTSGSDADHGGGGSYDYPEQSIFHYWVKDDGPSMPNIYNNTFYVGDGVTTSLFGEGNSGDNSNTIAHFTNNVMFKEGSGALKFLSAYPGNGGRVVEHRLHDHAERYIQHNLFSSRSIASVASGVDAGALESAGNLFADPKLGIESDPAKRSELAAQLDTVLADPQSTLPQTDAKTRIRARAAMFSTATDGAGVEHGTRMSDAPSEDFFGHATRDRAVDMGAAQVSDRRISTSYMPQDVTVTSPAGVYPALPTSIDVTVLETLGETSTQRVERRAVQWDYIKQNQYAQTGAFKVSGTIDGVPPDDVKANATVQVTGALGEGKSSICTDAQDDATVQRGSANTAMGAQSGSSRATDSSTDLKHPFGRAYSGNYVLRLKNSSSAGYNRRFYVKFDPSAFHGDLDTVKSAKVRVYVSEFNINNAAGGTSAEQLRNTAFRVDAYAVDAGWSSSALTWNNAPGRSDIDANHQPMGSGETIPTYEHGKPVASRVVTNGEIIDNGYAFDLDVTQYVHGLQATGPISLAIDMPMTATANFNRDNSGFDAFSSAGAAQAYADWKAGALQLPQSMQGLEMSAHALAPQLLLSDVYVKSLTPVEASIKPGEVPQLPGRVRVEYSDGSHRDVAVRWPHFDAQSFTHDGDFIQVVAVPELGRPVAAVIHVRSTSVVSVDDLPALDRFIGTSRAGLGMPDEVTVRLSDGTSMRVPVPGWDDDPSNFSESSAPGTYRFPGSLSLPVGIANPKGLKPFQTVRTHPRVSALSIAGGVGASGVVRPGQRVQFTVTVSTGDPYAVDDWCNQVTWRIERVDRQAARQGLIATQGVLSSEPSVDANGLLTVPEDAVAGEYRVVAQSSHAAGVTGSSRIRVISKDSGVITPPNPGSGGGDGGEGPGGSDGSGTGDSHHHGSGSDTHPGSGDGDSAHGSGDGGSGASPAPGDGSGVSDGSGDGAEASHGHASAADGTAPVQGAKKHDAHQLSIPQSLANTGNTMAGAVVVTLLTVFLAILLRVICVQVRRYRCSHAG